MSKPKTEVVLRYEVAEVTETRGAQVRRVALAEVLPENLETDEEWEEYYDGESLWFDGMYSGTNEEHAGIYIKTDLPLKPGDVVEVVVRPVEG